MDQSLKCCNKNKKNLYNYASDNLSIGCMEFMLVTSVNSFKCILKNKLASGGISMNRVLDAVVLGGSFLIYFVKLFIFINVIIYV